MKTRLLHVLTDSNIGGAGHQLLALLDALDANAYEIVVALPQGARLLPALMSRGVTCLEIAGLAERSFSWQAVKALRRYMRQFAPHIVHTHAALSGRVAARLYGRRRCKVVHTRHSVFDERKRPFPLGTGMAMLNNWLSDAVIAVSPAARDELLTLGINERKIAVIFNGIAPVQEADAAQRQQLRAQYDLPQDAYVAVQVARLTAVKGQDYVLDAAKMLPEVIFLLAGDGDLRAHLAERIANEGIHNVRLLGFVDAVHELVNIADVQLSASYGTEATSLALLQGMSVGKPTVATAYGGNPYVIQNGENGLLVPTHNPQAMAEAIDKIRSDSSLCRRLSDGARNRFQQDFTAQTMAEKAAQLYQRLLNTK